MASKTMPRAMRWIKIGLYVTAIGMTRLLLLK